MSMPDKHDYDNIPVQQPKVGTFEYNLYHEKWVREKLIGDTKKPFNIWYVNKKHYQMFKHEYDRRYDRKNKGRHKQNDKNQDIRRAKELTYVKPINKKFQFSELHHLTSTEGVYIPKDLHKSVNHSLRKGKERNMNLINKLVLDWYFNTYLKHRELFKEII